MSTAETARWVLDILFGYFLGGVLFSWHIPKLLKNIDICDLSDDHNPGTTNAMIFAGRRVASLCLFCDLLKGFLPVFFAVRWLNTESWLFAVVMAAPVLGHATAPFYKLSGGKSIAVSFGVLLALFPASFSVVILAFFYILFSTAIKITPVRVRSILTFAVSGAVSLAVCLWQGLFAMGLGCALISGIVIVKHLKRFSAETDLSREKAM